MSTIAFTAKPSTQEFIVNELQPTSYISSLWFEIKSESYSAGKEGEKNNVVEGRKECGRLKKKQKKKRNEQNCTFFFSQLFSQDMKSFGLDLSFFGR